LCEFPVVYQGYAGDYIVGTTEELTSEDALRRECVAQSTTMIFCYFFAWSLAFWSFGYPQLMRAAKANNENHQMPLGTSSEGNSHHTIITSGSAVNSNSSNGSDQRNQDYNNFQNGVNLESSTAIEDAEGQQQLNEDLSSELGGDVNHISGENEESHTVEPSLKNTDASCSCPQSATTVSNAPGQKSWIRRIWKGFEPVWQAIKQTTTSPGFIAMVLAFITACIPPLQRALFEPGGSLRFLGSAMEALGTASSPISTMVVAASLVPPEPLQNNSAIPERHEDDENDTRPVFDEQPGMTDPNFGPYRRPTRTNRYPSRFRELGRSLRSSSIRILQAVPRSTPEMRRLHIWYTLSRLVVAPAAVVLLLLAFDCSSSTLLSSVPNLAKFVIIVNASLPGALIVVVLLKSKEECADTAAAVSKVYLPSYLFSIVTIAAWCAVGLWITIPDKDGKTFCQQ
jgi:predicted permease